MGSPVTGIPQISTDAAGQASDRARLLRRQAEGAVSDRQRAQAKKISQDFEALFTGMMLKSMRETVGKDKLTGGGHGEEVYRSLLDQEYAAAMARRGGLGLAPVIEREILRQEARSAARPGGAGDEDK